MLRTASFLILLGALPFAAQAADHPFETDALREPALQTGGNALIRNVTKRFQITQDQGE